MLNVFKIFRDFTKLLRFVLFISRQINRKSYEKIIHTISTINNQTQAVRIRRWAAWALDAQAWSLARVLSVNSVDRQAQYLQCQ